VANARRSFTQADEISLTTQVGGYCPICGDALFYVKKSRSYKRYELAHIYPLNPKPEEAAELKNVRRLHADVNHPDNLIPLCTGCHTQFDKPRTREEYEELVALKERLIAKAAQRALNEEYPLEAAIGKIIARLHDVDFEEDAHIELELEAKSVEEKLDESLPGPTRRKIKHAVADYYQFIRREFREIELQEPTASQLIYSQVRTYYLKQKSLGLPQSAIFGNVVEWLRLTTSLQAPEAAEIVASFFVQNCEVFE
jgi:hypothetical protein